MKSPNESAAYLARLLRMNPLEQADAILAARSSFLGLTARAAEPQFDRQDVLQQREEMERRIFNIRARFWTLELARLERALGSLQLEAFPDLRLAGERLREAAVYRGEFPRLARHKHCHPDLFDLFKQVVVLPPREAAPLKESALSLAGRPNRQKRFKRMVRTMQKEFPRLFALEEEWLTMILESRPTMASVPRTDSPAGSSYSSGGSDSGSFGWPLWIVVIVVIKVILALARMSQH